MAALLKCFRRQKNQDDDENLDFKNSSNQNEKLHHKCKCKKLIQCPTCNSTLLGHWEPHGVSNGRVGSKTLNDCFRARADRDSQTSSDSSSNTPLQTPISTLPPSSSGNNNSAFTHDYTPSAQADLPGVSYMPVSKMSPNYNMNHRRRGKAVIFNFNQFNQVTNLPTLDLEPRAGSDKDKRDLANCLKKLAFDVVTYDNLRRQDFDNVISEVQKEDHSDADCLLIAIMSHGKDNSIYTSDGTTIPVNTVWQEFESNNCPSLAAKPKIFIIQACRGLKYDHGTPISGGGRAGTPGIQYDVTDSGNFSYVIPNAADILVAFSCPLGHYSWRHPEQGSWFIQSICKIFNEFAYQGVEIKELMTKVSLEVAVNYESKTYNVESHNKKQVPSTSSTMIRNLVFTPKQLPPITSAQIEPFPAELNAGQQTEISLQQVQVAIEEAQLATTNETDPDPLNEPEPMSLEVPPLVAVSDLRSVQDGPPLIDELTPVMNGNNDEEDLGSDDDPSVASDTQGAPIIKRK